MEITFNVNTDKGSMRKNIEMEVVPSKGSQVFIANQMLHVDSIVFIPDDLEVIVYLWREGHTRAKVFKAYGWVTKKINQRY